MNRRISLDELAEDWMADPEFLAEYDALEDEFELAAALIETRAKAGMTQAQVVEKVDASRSFHTNP